MAPLPYPAATTNAVPLARDLAAYGDRPALVTTEGEVSYRDLAARADSLAQRLRGRRRLVLLAAGNTVDSVVTYLAALGAGHPVLLAPGDRPETVESLVAAYDPDVLAGGHAGQWRIDERRASSAHALHPDLALLLSTSGSTGSAKLVRLSHENVQANAEAIASYLGIRAGDRAATTLPLHYCYGLSILNSHLVRGAAVILTGLSVADPCFWDLFRDRRGTAFAGVPYTFDLLDRIGFEAMSLPHLRYVTQAGGRLAADRVRRYAALGRRNGWDLFVMYGQTEATARMAYLPPDLALSHPRCIGVPIPGGSFRLDPLPGWSGPDTGELVYAGPNVMLGYAESPSDLRLGRTVNELRTGDIARRTGDGLYEIVGRRSRFVKIFGLRIDLAGIEAMLRRQGLAAHCVGVDGELFVAVADGRGAAAGGRGAAAGGADAGDVRRLVARESGLPVRTVRVRLVAELPRLPNGKPDYPAVEALAAATAAEAVSHGDRAGRAPARPAARRATAHPSAGLPDLCRLYAEVLGRSDVTENSTFVDLGGDSLSYVEMSVRLEQALGHLPAAWHTTAIRDLRPATDRCPTTDRCPATGRSAPPRRTWGSLDTSTALRAISIVLIVGTHATLFDLPGGAHLLLAVAGYNVARFHLTAARRRERAGHLGRSIRRIAVASMCWIALAAVLLTNDYTVANVLLVNYLVGVPGQLNHFWFIETLVYILLALLAAMAIPAVDRMERRHPFGLPMAVMAVGLVTRYQLIPGVRLPTPLVAFWLFALGWAAAKAGTGRQRLYVTVAVAATVPGFFSDLAREAVIVAGLVLLVWLPTVPSVRPVNRVAGVLAGSSLYIYLTHWQVFPHLSDRSAVLALIVSLAAGVGYARVAPRLTARISGVPELVAARARRPGQAARRKVRPGRAAHREVPGSPVRQPVR